MKYHMEYRPREDKNNERSFDNWSLWVDVDYPANEEVMQPYDLEDDWLLMVTYEAKNDTEAFIKGQTLITDYVRSYDV